MDHSWLLSISPSTDFLSLPSFSEHQIIHPPIALESVATFQSRPAPHSLLMSVQRKSLQRRTHVAPARPNALLELEATASLQSPATKRAVDYRDRYMKLLRCHVQNGYAPALLFVLSIACASHLSSEFYLFAGTPYFSSSPASP